MRRLIVASAILATFLITPFGLAAATPAPSTSPTDSERATAALGYLLAAQGADGSIDASIGETADFVIGAAAAGYDPATLHGCSAGTGALDYLAAATDGASGYWSIACSNICTASTPRRSRIVSSAAATSASGAFGSFGHSVYMRLYACSASANRLICS